MIITRRALFAAAALPLKANTLAPGSLRFRWNYGSICAARNRDPRIQVIAYNPSTIVMRQNVAVHWEAPFTYLLAGTEKALLIDTGATPEPNYYPLRTTIDGLLSNLRNLPLTIVHTSAEDIALNQGVSQFKGRPNTTVLTKPTTFDLGNRVITVIPTPGTHKDGLTFYDRYTGLLFTGDLLFPGRIHISNDADYIRSLETIEAFVKANPVRWLLGAHIEMTAGPGIHYPMRTNFKPNEHALQLEPEAIGEALQHARRLQGKSDVAIRAEFHLLNRVGVDYRGDWPSDLPPVPVAPFNLR